MSHSLEPALRTIVTGICREPDSIRLEFLDGTFFLNVHSTDYGRCVGKQGSCIWALNTIMWYAGIAKLRQKLLVKLVGDNSESGRVLLPFKAKKNWNKGPIVAMLETALTNCFNSDAMGSGVVLAYPAFIIETTVKGRAVVMVRLDAYLKTPMSEPSFSEALSTLVHAAGMVQGVSIDTTFDWK